MKIHGYSYNMRILLKQFVKKYKILILNDMILAYIFNGY